MMTEQNSSIDDFSRMITRPVFLVGAERSGTTLLRLMLDHHPDIAFHFEFEFSVAQIAEDGTFPQVNDYQRWLRTNRVFNHAGWSIDESLDYRHLVNSFLLQKKAAAGNKPVIGATVHLYFHQLRTIWPDARFIHILRDGRDVSRSVIQMGWAGNPWDAARVWEEAEHTWAKLRPQLSDDDFCEIRYEQLVTDPQATLTELCEFMGTPYDPRMLNYDESSTYKKPDPSLIGQWRRKMTPRQVQLCEAYLGDLLTEKGYEPSGFPRLKVGALRARWLGLHSRYKRNMFRIHRYGVRLWLGDLFSRRLGIESWQNRVREARHAIEIAQLR